MKVTTIKAETTVAAVADRLFINLNAEQRKAAEAALIRANPHLERPEMIKAGTVINVPEVKGVKIKATEIGKDPVADMIEGLGDAVSGYQKHLLTRLEAERADLADQKALLKQKELAAAIKSTPGAAETAADLTKSLAERDKKAAEEEKQLKAVFEAIANDLASFK